MFFCCVNCLSHFVYVFTWYLTTPLISGNGTKAIISLAHGINVVTPVFATGFE